MESNGVVNFRHRRSPSSERFLDIFSSSPSDTIAGDELNEDDVFWTGDFAEPNRRSLPVTSPSTDIDRSGFRRSDRFGILAVLPEDNRKKNSPVLYRKPSIPSTSPISSSRTILAIPKPPVEREYSQSMPARKFQQSAPMNVPMMPKKVRTVELAEVDIDDGEDDEMLPPHEIVARGSAMSQQTTFSVLEGVGRTLKGRDLRQVRNAVWRRTGFLD